MTLIQRVDGLLATWLLLMPHIVPPAPEDAARWLSYRDDIVEAAILRTSKKFSKQKLSADFNPAQAYRYATATARTMAATAINEKQFTQTALTEAAAAPR